MSSSQPPNLNDASKAGLPGNEAGGTANDGGASCHSKANGGEVSCHSKADDGGASCHTGRAAVEAAIPHRAPMLLVDEIVAQSETEIHCRKTFRADEFFTQGHFPNYPLVPGVILCECALQSGAILLASKTPTVNAVPVATRLDGVKFKQMVRPGDKIDIHVTLNEAVSSAYFMTGKIIVDGKVAARLDFACTVAAPKG